MVRGGVSECNLFSVHIHAGYFSCHMFCVNVHVGYFLCAIDWLYISVSRHSVVGGGVINCCYNTHAWD